MNSNTPAVSPFETCHLVGVVAPSCTLLAIKRLTPDADEAAHRSAKTSAVPTMQVGERGVLVRRVLTVPFMWPPVLVPLLTALEADTNSVGTRRVSCGLPFFFSRDTTPSQQTSVHCPLVDVRVVCGRRGKQYIDGVNCKGGWHY